jgi:hypothetical protein
VIPTEVRDGRVMVFNGHVALTFFLLNDSGRNSTNDAPATYGPSTSLWGKYRCFYSSNGAPRPGWTPDPMMVGIRSPDGLVVGSCTSHPGVLGEEPGKTGRRPVLKYRVPHGSQPRPGQAPDPRWTAGWARHPGVLGSIPMSELSQAQVDR